MTTATRALRAPRHGARSRGRVAAIWLGLTAATLALFLAATRGQFLNYDDLEYVVENPVVRGGLQWRGVRWALTATQVANWHPLTWMSHMLDVTLFGLSPAGHHLTSVLIHAANGALLLLVLRALTGRLWSSALVAALFALHPLRVESVAWVAERKDVLSALAWLLTLAAYLGYARRRGAWRYALTLALFALGLAAKPMLVTLPVVLLLLDYWPLGRLGPAGCAWRGAWILVREKLPLFALAGASCVVTLAAQSGAGAVQQGQELGFPVRLANAALSLWGYLGKSLWPAGLSVYYPHPQESISFAGAALAGLALAAAAAAILRHAARNPVLLVGSAWYLVTLVPVIGLVQVGSQAMANRYTYIPGIGPALAAVWVFRGALAGRPGLPLRAGALAGATLLSFSLITHRELTHWRDSATLFGRAIEVTGGGTWIVHHNLARALRDEGRVPEALEQYRAALRYRDNAATRTNIGNIHLAQGNLLAAETEFRSAIALQSSFAEAHNNLGVVLVQRGRPDLAVTSLEEAVRLLPDYGDAHFNLATTLESQGRVREAVVHYREALRIRPDDAMAAARLSYALASLEPRR